MFRSQTDDPCWWTSHSDVKVQAPFGFVTGCQVRDKFLVQPTLASMRDDCPDVTICLTVDGNFDVSDLQNDYNLIVLRVSEVPSTEMGALMWGNHGAKLAARWEGPFEFYVWFDSDAIAWGDFTSQVRTDLDFQIFWSEISIPADATEIPPWLLHFYFDPQKLRQFDADFEWRGHAYFSAGAFACRRNAISFRRWTEVESWEKKVPGLFAWEEDRKSTRLNSSHTVISYAVFCLKKKMIKRHPLRSRDTMVFIEVLVS